MLLHILVKLLGIAQVENTMWRMPGGDRVLTEAEWALFRAGLELLRDYVEENIRSENNATSTGIRVFDNLSPEQQLALIADVAQALRDPVVPTPRHTAANEGAIAAILATVRELLMVEIDEDRMGWARENPTEIRRLLLGVCTEPEGREPPLPDETDFIVEEWECLLEEFESRILWDRDFDMDDEFLDLPPEEGRKLLKAARIDPEYYLETPSEPGEKGLTAARQTLARLLGLPVADEDGLYPALDDLYHSLTIGPCSPDEIAAWEDNPWVQVIGMTEPGWDCDYPTWAAGFSEALPTTPFQLTSATAEGDQELPGRLSVERRGDAWVIRDRDGSYWCGLIENGWTGTPDDDDMPALTFPSESEAKSAYAQADQMYSEREKRHEQALAQLGLADE